ncbi:MAG: NADH-quinone oxidoreductase subunit N [bacterium]|nr:NADH-quinone oxidoreductase subunit N [bacterium]
MTLDKLWYLSPVIILGITVLLLMLSASIKRSSTWPFVLTELGLFLALIASFIELKLPATATDLLIIDEYGLLGGRLILAAAMVITYFSFEYLKPKNENSEEFYLLLLISTFGAMVMVFSNHFFSFFLGIEVLTIPLYALIAYFHERSKGLEAAIKYLILAGSTSAFLLFGMVLIYAEHGTMRFDLVADRFSLIWSEGRSVLLFGLAFLSVGMFFKISAVPFHMWTPDVYEGAPLPVTAFLATVSKGATVILLVRFFINLHSNTIAEWQLVLSSVAILSMFVGNLMALMQKNIKRLIAYSSIAHIGYILVGVIAGTMLGAHAILFYLLTYFIAVLLMFGALIFLENKQSDFISINSVRGLFYERPAISLAIIIALLSLLGLPLTAGFMGKYWILLVGVSTTEWTLLVCIIISSSIGLYAYLKVILALFAKRATTGSYAHYVSKKGFAVVLTLLVFLTFALGVVPNYVLEAVRNARIFI